MGPFKRSKIVQQLFYLSDVDSSVFTSSLGARCNSVVEHPIMEN